MLITQVGTRVVVKSKATGGKKPAKSKATKPTAPVVIVVEPAAAAAVDDDGGDDSQDSEQRLLWYRPIGNLHEALGGSVNPQFAFDFTPVLPVPRSVWKVLFHGWFAPIALFLWWFLLLLSSLNVLPRAPGTIAVIAVFSVAGFVVTAALTDRWLLWRLVTYFEWAYISALALVFVGISIAQEVHTVGALGLESSSGSSGVSSTTVAAIVFPLVLWLQATLTLVSMDALVALRSAKLRLVLLVLLIVDNCLIMFYDRVVRIPAGLIVPFPICTLYCTDSQSLRADMLTLITFFLGKYAFLCVLTMLRIKAENDELQSDDSGSGRRLPMSAPGARPPATADDPFVPFFMLHSSVALTSFQDAKAEQQQTSHDGSGGGGGGGDASAGEQRDDESAADGVFPFVSTNTSRRNHAAAVVGASAPAFSWAFLNQPSDASLALSRVSSTASLSASAQKSQSTGDAAATDDRVTIRIAAGYPQLTRVPILVLKSSAFSATATAALTQASSPRMTASAAQRSAAHSAAKLSPLPSGTLNVRAGRLPALIEMEFTSGSNSGNTVVRGRGNATGASLENDSGDVLDLVASSTASAAATTKHASSLDGSASGHGAASVTTSTPAAVPGSGMISLYANTLAQATGIKVSSKSRNRANVTQADENVITLSPPLSPTALDTTSVDATESCDSLGNAAESLLVAKAPAASSSRSPANAVEAARMARRGGSTLGVAVAASKTPKPIADSRAVYFDYEPPVRSPPQIVLNPFYPHLSGPRQTAALVIDSFPFFERLRAQKHLAALEQKSAAAADTARTSLQPAAAAAKPSNKTRSTSSKAARVVALPGAIPETENDEDENYRDTDPAPSSSPPESDALASAPVPFSSPSAKSGSARAQRRSSIKMHHHRLDIDAESGVDDLRRDIAIDVDAASSSRAGLGSPFAADAALGANVITHDRLRADKTPAPALAASDFRRAFVAESASASASADPSASATAGNVTSGNWNGNAIGGGGAKSLTQYSHAASANNEPLPEFEARRSAGALRVACKSAFPIEFPAFSSFRPLLARPRALQSAWAHTWFQCLIASLWVLLPLLLALELVTNWSLCFVYAVGVALFVAAQSARIDRFCFTELLTRDAEWIYLVWQLLYYSILSVYQSSFEVDLYGAAVLGVDAPLFYAIQLVTQLFWLGSAFFIVSLDAFVVPHRIKLWVIAMFIARNILTMVTESFVSPQHFSPAPVCIVTCTMTTKLRLNMLLQLTVFGLKYLVHQVSARGVMSLLTSSVVHQVAIAPKSAAKEPTSKASAAPALKTRSAALSAVV